MYLHEEKEIIHRDIKPDNIMMTENYQPKIGDMGNAKNTLISKNTKNNKGNLTYWAPELCESNDVEKGEDYDFKIDVWAFGILAIELLLRKSIFRFVNPSEIPAKMDGFP